MPIRCFGFGKAKFKSTPFVSNVWLILVESSTKPKQTPPKWFLAKIPLIIHMNFSSSKLKLNFELRNFELAWRWYKVATFELVVGVLRGKINQRYMLFYRLPFDRKNPSKVHAFNRLPSLTYQPTRIIIFQSVFWEKDMCGSYSTKELKDSTPFINCFLLRDTKPCQQSMLKLICIVHLL
jgi:hypothetical protein